MWSSKAYHQEGAGDLPGLPAGVIHWLTVIHFRPIFYSSMSRCSFFHFLLQSLSYELLINAASRRTGFFSFAAHKFSFGDDRFLLFCCIDVFFGGGSFVFWCQSDVFLWNCWPFRLERRRCASILTYFASQDNDIDVSISAGNNVPISLIE